MDRKVIIAVLLLALFSLTASVSAQDIYNFYYGNLHSHTSYSDGMLTPTDAYAYAKDVANIDFLAVTDHGYMLNETEYDDMLQQANNYTEDGVFVAIQGFEWSAGVYGHIAVINTPTFTSCEVAPTLNEIYSFVRNNNGTAIFAHPAWPGNHFEYFSSLEGDDVVRGIEVGNGYDYEGMIYATFESIYIEALDKGWYVGAMVNQDNHHANWGDGRGWIAVISPNLTKENTLTAIKDMKYYGTEDRNFELTFKANGHWMGEIFIPGENLTFNITVKDNDKEDNISSIDLYEDGKVIESKADIDSNISVWTPVVTPAVGGHYYFIKVTEEDGDRIWSSPIWTLANYDVLAIGLSFSPAYPLIGNDTILTAKIVNQGTSTVEIETKFYYDHKDDEHLIGIATKNVSSKEITTASINWTAIEGKHVIYAVISPIDGDNPYDNEISREIRVSTGNITTRIVTTEYFGVVTNETVRELFDIVIGVPLGTTALEALKSVATVNEVGGFIVGINDIEADYDNNLYWFNFVNGITAQVGAGDYILNNGDVVRFDYHKWAPNASYCEVMDYPEPFFHGYNGTVWNTTIVYPDGSDSYDVVSQNIKDKIVELGVPDIAVSIRSDAEITSTEKESNNLILIGTPSENELTGYVNNKRIELGMTAYFEGEEIIDLWDNITYCEGGLIEALDNPYDGISTWMVGPVVWLVSGTSTKATKVASEVLIEEPNRLNRFWAIIPDEEPPEAEVMFNSHTLEIDVLGTDNLDEDVEVTSEETIFDGCAIRNYTLTDDCQNALTLTLKLMDKNMTMDDLKTMNYADNVILSILESEEKDKITKLKIKEARILALAYNDEEKEVPWNKMRIIYLLKEDELKILIQNIKVQEQFSIFALYNAKINKTILIVNGNVKLIDGLAMVKLLTDNGDLTYRDSVPHLLNNHK